MCSGATKLSMMMSLDYFHKVANWAERLSADDVDRCEAWKLASGVAGNLFRRPIHFSIARRRRIFFWKSSQFISVNTRPSNWYSTYVFDTIYCYSTLIVKNVPKHFTVHNVFPKATSSTNVTTLNFYFEFAQLMIKNARLFAYLDYWYVWWR